MGTKLLLYLSLAFFYHYLTAHFLFGLHYNTQCSYCRMGQGGRNVAGGRVKEGEGAKGRKMKERERREK